MAARGGRLGCLLAEMSPAETLHRTVLNTFEREERNVITIKFVSFKSIFNCCKYMDSPMDFGLIQFNDSGNEKCVH